MNQRIRELADEAAKFSAIMALPTGEAGDNLFVEKFAQLLVRECADISENHKGMNDKYFIADAIKKHFGVEQ